MKIQRQGRKECFLATVAMLSDTNLSEVRTIANNIATQYNFDRFTSIFSTYGDINRKRQVALLIAKKFKVARYVDVTRFSMNIFDLSFTGKPIDLSGRGSVNVTIYHPNSDVIASRHIMAYDNNIIYDPEMDNPTTVAVWFTLNPTAKIEDYVDGSTSKQKILNKILS